MESVCNYCDYQTTRSSFCDANCRYITMEGSYFSDEELEDLWMFKFVPEWFEYEEGGN